MLGFSYFRIEQLPVFGELISVFDALVFSVIILEKLSKIRGRPLSNLGVSSFKCAVLAPSIRKSSLSKVGSFGFMTNFVWIDGV